MKRSLIIVAILFVLSAVMLAQDANTQSSDHPSGTVVTKTHVDTEVQPAAKKVAVTPDMVRAAQEKLNDKGYKAGTPTGRMNVTTRRAIRKFQKAEKIKVTGKLDESTLSHLNIAGADTLGAAPGDVGRGGKAAGHDVKEGHPVAAAKAMGKGVGRFGKKVGMGTKSVVVGTKDKISGEQKDKDSTPSNPPQN